MTATAKAGDVLRRLRGLYPTLIDLSLGRLDILLEKLGRPERQLPPVIHVAGTNGKGSTCAFLRAIGEAAGLRVHVMTSPHLVSATERFRVAGKLVSAGALADILAEVEVTNGGAPITVFEALTAAGFLLFSRVEAEFAVIEVGLGGRFDATNVVGGTVATIITSISLDHEGFLGPSLAGIAGEKAGIMRPGRPCSTGRHPRAVEAVLEEHARTTGAVLLRRDRDWSIEEEADRLRFRDAGGTALILPRPSLLGAHQVENAGLAIAALRNTDLLLPASAFDAISTASWPARMQRLGGRLAALLPPSFELWLDGGHNEGGGRAIAAVLDRWSDQPRYLIVGMKDTKDPARFLSPLVERATALYLVEEQEQDSPATLTALHEAAGPKALAGPTIEGALQAIATRSPGRVLICGSLHLAGVALGQDGFEPV